MVVHRVPGIFSLLPIGSAPMLFGQTLGINARRYACRRTPPWKALAEFVNTPSPPEDGDIWRVNFFHVQWRHTVSKGRHRKLSDTRECNWVSSSQGAVNMHIPDRWGYVAFVQASLLIPDDARERRK